MYARKCTSAVQLTWFVWLGLLSDLSKHTGEREREREEEKNKNMTVNMALF